MTLAESLSHLSFMLLLFFVLPTQRISCPGRAIILLLAGALSFVTIEGLSLADYSRSYADDLSMMSVLWLLYAGFSQLLNKKIVPLQQQTQFAVCIAVMGLILYPAALGLSFVDPYRWGFSAQMLLLAVFASCVLWWWLRNYFALVITTIATLLFVFDIKASVNYWDYLIDPLLWLFCCGHLAKRVFLGWLAARRGFVMESKPAFTAREA